MLESSERYISDEEFFFRKTTHIYEHSELLKSKVFINCDTASQIMELAEKALGEFGVNSQQDEFGHSFSRAFLSVEGLDLDFTVVPKNGSPEIKIVKPLGESAKLMTWLYEIIYLMQDGNGCHILVENDEFDKGFSVRIDYYDGRLSRFLSSQESQPIISDLSKALEKAT